MTSNHAGKKSANACRRAPQEIDLAVAEPVLSELRRLSPSDFGFHNALREAAGRLRFVDFEYAGWDDPAKLACDFFCQPALPVPMRFWSSFLANVTEDLPEAERQRRRIALLLPVYRIKWVTILLNDFHAVGNDRRRFARPGVDPERRRAEQAGEGTRVSGPGQCCAAFG